MKKKQLRQLNIYKNITTTATYNNTRKIRISEFTSYRIRKADLQINLSSDLSCQAAITLQTVTCCRDWLNRNNCLFFFVQCIPVTRTYMLTLLAHDGVGEFTYKDAVHKVQLYTFLPVRLWGEERHILSRISSSFLGSNHFWTWWYFMTKHMRMLEHLEWVSQTKEIKPYVLTTGKAEGLYVNMSIICPKESEVTNYWNGNCAAIPPSTTRWDYCSWLCNLSNLWLGVWCHHPLSFPWDY